MERGGKCLFVLAPKEEEETAAGWMEEKRSQRQSQSQRGLYVPRFCWTAAAHAAGGC